MPLSAALTFRRQREVGTVVMASSRANEICVLGAAELCDVLWRGHTLGELGTVSARSSAALIEGG